MEKVIRELEEIGDSKENLWANWGRDLKKAFIINFDNHLPKTASIPRVNELWMENLRRLLGSTKPLADVRKQLHSE